MREKLSHKAGRRAMVRSAQCVMKEHWHPESLVVPAGDPVGNESHRRGRIALKKAKKAKKKKKKRKKRKKRSSSSSSRSSGATSDLSERRKRVFRRASDLARSAARSQRAAVENPDKVVLESSAELCAVLPAARPGASSSSMTQHGGSPAKFLPSLFVPYFMLMLDKKLQGPGMQRNEREARTLCEMLDAVLEGRTMQATMLPLERLMAVEAYLDSDAGGCCMARQLEMAARRGQGPLTGRDRMLAIQDTRDEQRGSGRLPTRQDGGGGGRRQHLRHE